MYLADQPVESRTQDGFWEWFAPGNIELLQAWPPAGLLVGLVDGFTFTPSSDTPRLASAGTGIPLPFYCLTNYQCAWCWRSMGGFCGCYKKGLRIFLDEGWEPLNHIFHLVLVFLVPTKSRFPACPERAWWRSVQGLLVLNVAIRSLCFSVPAGFFPEPHAQNPAVGVDDSPYPRPCTDLRRGDEAHVRALGVAVFGEVGVADGCPCDCGAIIGVRPWHEWYADSSYHRVESPLQLPWVWPYLPSPKARWDYLWFRRVCLWWVASYNTSGGLGDYFRVGLDRDPVVREWILHEETYPSKDGYTYFVPFPSPDAWRCGY